MGKSTVFNGQFIKTLKANLNLSDDAYILTGTDNPTAVAKNAPKGSLYLRQTPSGDGEVYVKNDNGNTTNWQNLNKIKIAVQDLMPGASGQTVTGLTVPATKAYDINYLAERQLDAFNKNTTMEASGFRRINTLVNCLAVHSNGKIFIGANRTDYGFVTGRNIFFGFNSDGTLDTAFTANASDGGKFNDEVRAVAIQPDGKILIGGAFTNYAGTSGRNRLIRLNSDGTLDTAFTANASDGNKFNDVIYSLAIQSDGKILIGGSFSSYAGTFGRSHLVRLNSDGTLDTSFVANAVDGGKFSGTVRSIVIQPDGKILVGGVFTNYSGTSGRSCLVRLNSDGTLDTSFVANATDGGKFNNTVYSVAIQSDGKILVGGIFTNYAGTAGRDRLIRFNSDGTVDVPFVNNVTDGSKFNNIVFKIAIARDNMIFVAGQFTNYAGATGRNNLICLLNDGSLNTAVTAAASDFNKFNGYINLLEIAGNNVFVSGSFSTYQSESGPLLYFVKLNLNGITGDHFTANAADGEMFSGAIYNVIAQPDNKILVSGVFTNYAGIPGRNRLIRLNSDGILDASFAANAVDGGKFNNIIYSSAIQSDGKILVGGDFTNYAGTSDRNRLIRLNSDGTLDTAFVANATDGNKFTGTVRSIAIQPDGKILVGGVFTNYSGTSGRNYLIRLNSDGTLDTSFVANATDGSKFSAPVYSMAIQSDGKILVGGDFTNYAGTSGRNRLVRLNSDGTLDTSFVTNASDGNKFISAIQSIVIQSDGKILVGGDFTNYAGTSGRNRLICLNSDGTLDTAFTANTTDGGKFNNPVYSVAIQSDGKILIGGAFTGYAGVSGRNYMIRLNTDGTLDISFVANAVDINKFTNTIYSVAIQSDGKILVGGYFTNYASTSGRNRLIRLNSDGTLDYNTPFYLNYPLNALISLNNKFNYYVTSIAAQNDGKVLVGGHFSNYGGLQYASHLIRINSNGALDTSFVNNIRKKMNNAALAIVPQPDGKILVGGTFTSYAGTSGRSYLVRLNSDGALDTSFVANATDGDKFIGAIRSMAIQSDGKILVGGEFTDYAGTSGRNYLIRLNSDGTLDTSFVANATDGNKFTGTVRSIAIQPDGKILVGGSFANYASASGRNRLIRLNSDGTLDTAFAANATDGSKFSAPVYSMAIQSDGKILVGGNFTNYAGTLGRDRLIRLNSDGTLDTAFTANASDGNKFNNIAYSIAIQSDGKILVGGDFTNYAGTSGRNRLIRLNSDGTLDTSFVTNATDGGKFSAPVYSMAVQSDGKILVGGDFTNFSGYQYINYLVILRDPKLFLEMGSVSAFNLGNNDCFLSGHTFGGIPAELSLDIDQAGTVKYSASDTDSVYFRLNWFVLNA